MTPLVNFDQGMELEVIEIRSGTPERPERLGAFGIGPGARIWLHQKWPAYVIQVGHTDLAIDEHVARDILVRPISC